MKNKNYFGLLGLFATLGLYLTLVACNSGSTGPAPVNPLQPNGPILPQQLYPTGPMAYRAESGISSNATLQLTDTFKGYLKNAMGVCDRCSNSGGLASCSAWMSGYNDLTVKFNSTGAGSNYVAMIIRSSPKINNYANYSWNFPSAGDFFLWAFTGGWAPMASCSYSGYYPSIGLNNLSMKTSNSDAGFTIYGEASPYMSAWNRRLINLYVDSGHAGDSSLPFRLTIRDENSNEIPMANGQLQLCQPGICDL